MVKPKTGIATMTTIEAIMKYDRSTYYLLFGEV